MVKSFNDFLTEYHSYTGPKSRIGFKNFEPTEIFGIMLNVENNVNLEEYIIDIFKKYNIPGVYKIVNAKVKKLFLYVDSSKYKSVAISFKSFNGYEAESISSTIINNLVKNGINVIDVIYSKNIKQLRNTASALQKNSEFDNNEQVRNPIGFKK